MTTFLYTPPEGDDAQVSLPGYLGANPSIVGPGDTFSVADEAQAQTITDSGDDRFSIVDDSEHVDPVLAERLERAEAMTVPELQQALTDLNAEPGKGALKAELVDAYVAAAPPQPPADQGDGSPALGDVDELEALHNQTPTGDDAGDQHDDEDDDR